jgi:hypothetical protein
VGGSGSFDQRPTTMQAQTSSYTLTPTVGMHGPRAGAMRIRTVDNYLTAYCVGTTDLRFWPTLHPRAAVADAPKSSSFREPKKNPH